MAGNLTFNQALDAVFDVNSETWRNDRSAIIKVLATDASPNVDALLVEKAEIFDQDGKSVYGFALLAVAFAHAASFSKQNCNRILKKVEEKVKAHNSVADLFRDAATNVEVVSKAKLNNNVAEMLVETCFQVSNKPSVELLFATWLIAFLLDQETGPTKLDQRFALHKTKLQLYNVTNVRAYLSVAVDVAHILLLCRRCEPQELFKSIWDFLVLFVHQEETQPHPFTLDIFARLIDKALLQRQHLEIDLFSDQRMKWHLQSIGPTDGHRTLLKWTLEKNANILLSLVRHKDISFEHDQWVRVTDVREVFFTQLNANILLCSGSQGCLILVDVAKILQNAVKVLGQDCTVVVDCLHTMEAIELQLQSIPDTFCFTQEVHNVFPELRKHKLEKLFGRLDKGTSTFKDVVEPLDHLLFEEVETFLDRACLDRILPRVPEREVLCLNQTRATGTLGTWLWAEWIRIFFARLPEHEVRHRMDRISTQRNISPEETVMVSHLLLQSSKLNVLDSALVTRYQGELTFMNPHFKRYLALETHATQIIKELLSQSNNADLTMTKIKQLEEQLIRVSPIVYDRAKVTEVSEILATTDARLKEWIASLEYSLKQLRRIVLIMQRTSYPFDEESYTAIQQCVATSADVTLSAMGPVVNVARTLSSQFFGEDNESLEFVLGTIVNAEVPSQLATVILMSCMEEALESNQTVAKVFAAAHQTAISFAQNNRLRQRADAEIIRRLLDANSGVDIELEVHLFQSVNIALRSMENRIRFRKIHGSSGTLIQMFVELLPHNVGALLMAAPGNGLEQGTPVANNLLQLSSAQISFLLRFANCSLVIKYAQTELRTKLRRISLNTFREEVLVDLANELMTHDGASFALVQHLRYVVEFLVCITSFENVESLTANFPQILTPEVVESLNRLEELDRNIDAVARIVVDGGSESTRLRSSAAEVLQAGSRYVIQVRHGAQQHASIQKADGSPFEFNGKPLEGDNLLQWRQCVNLTLSDSTTQNEQQQHAYLEQLSTDEVRISHVLQQLCDSGHVNYQRASFAWDLTHAGEADNLERELKFWVDTLRGCLLQYPPLLLVPLSLVVQALERGFTSSMTALFPPNVFAVSDQQTLTVDRCANLTEFVTRLCDFLVPLETWTYQRPRQNAVLEVLRYTLGDVTQQPEEFTFPKLMQRILSNYIVSDNRKPFAFEWLIATDKVTAFEIQMFCQRVTVFQGYRFTVFGAHFLHPLVRKELVHYIAEHNESMTNLTVTCQGYVTDFVYAKCQQVFPPSRTAQQSAEGLIEALGNLPFVNETAVSVVGPSGSGKSYELSRRFEGRSVHDVWLHTAEVENTLFESLQMLEDSIDVVVIHPSMVSLGRERGVASSTDETLHKLYFALMQLWLLKCYHDGQGRYLAIKEGLTIAVEFPDAVKGDGMTVVPFLTHLLTRENCIQLSLEGVVDRMVLGDDAELVLRCFRFCREKAIARRHMYHILRDDVSDATFDEVYTQLDNAKPLAGDDFHNFLLDIPLRIREASFYVINAWIAVAAARLRLVLGSPQFAHYLLNDDYFGIIFNKVIPRLLQDATMLVQPPQGIGSDSLTQLGGLLLPNSDFNLVSFPSGYFEEIETTFHGGRASLVQTCANANLALANCFYCHGCDSFCEEQGGRMCAKCNRVGRMVKATELDAYALVFLGWTCAFEELVEMRKSLTRLRFVLIKSTVFKMMLIAERMRSRDALIICSESGVGKTRTLQALAVIQATSALRAYKINFELHFRELIVTFAQELQAVVHQYADNPIPATQVLNFRSLGVDVAFRYLKRMEIVIPGNPAIHVQRPHANNLAGAQNVIRDLIVTFDANVRAQCPPHIELEVYTAGVDRDLVEGAIDILQDGATTSPLLSTKIMVHPKFTAQTMIEKLREPFAFAHKLLEAGSNLTVVVFFDELNTSDNPGIFHALIRDRVLPNGEAVPSNVFFVGAVNPSSADNRYSVLDLPTSLKYAQVEFHAPSAEERCLYVNEVISATANSSLMQSMVGGQTIQDHLAHLVQMAHTFSEQYTKDVDKASVVSQRDIQRTLHVYTTVVELLHRCDAEQQYEEYDDRTQLRAMTTAVWYAYVERLPAAGQHDVSLASQLNEYLSPVIRLVFEHDSPLQFGEIVLDTVRRIVTAKHFRIPPGIALTDILRRNILHVLLAVMAENPRMSCAIVGPPGKGKTLAVRIVEENLKGPQWSTDFFKNDKPLDVIYLLGSDATTAAELFDVMKRAIMVEKMKKNSTRVLICFDEAGLPKNQRLVLKAVHDAIDESSVTFVCLSNTPFDPANQGRMLTRFMGDASAEDIYDLIVGCLGFTVLHAEDAWLGLARGLALGYQGILSQARNDTFLQSYTQRELTNLCRYLSSCCHFDGRFLDGAFALKDLIVGVEFNNIAETPTQTEIICQHYCEGLIRATQNREAWQYREDLLRSSHDVVLASFARTRREETYMRTRYKALIDYNDDLSSTLPLIDAIQKKYTNVTHLYLSSFPDDKTPVEDTKLLAKLRHFMMQGAHVIVYNGGRILRSLFDLLNINFQCVANKDFAKLSVNGQTTRCEVHQNFQITFVMPMSMIPLLGDSRDPFMSRVEKYYIPPPVYPRQDITKKVEEFARDFVGRSSFAGFTKECSVALALLNPAKDAVTPPSLDDDGKIVYCANTTLLRQCDAAALVNCRHLLQNAEYYLEHYFGDNAHFSLHEVRKKFLQDPTRPLLFLTTSDTHGLACLMHQKDQRIVAVRSADAAQSINEIIHFLSNVPRNANEKSLRCIAVEHLSTNSDTLRLLRHHVCEARVRNNAEPSTEGHLYAIIVITPTTFPVHPAVPTADPRGSFTCYHLDTVTQPSPHVLSLLRRGVSRDPEALPMDNNNNNNNNNVAVGEDHLQGIDFTFVVREFVAQDRHNRQRLLHKDIPYYRETTTVQQREDILNGIIDRLPLLQEMLLDVAKKHLTRGRLRRLLVNAANAVVQGTQKGSLTEHFANDLRQAVAKGASRAFSCIVDNFALVSLERTQHVGPLQDIIRCYVDIVGANPPPAPYVRPPHCIFNPWLHQLMLVWLRKKGGRILQSSRTFQDKAVELQQMFQQEPSLALVNSTTLSEEEQRQFVSDAVAVVASCNLCAWANDPCFLEVVCREAEGMQVSPILFALLIPYDTEFVLQLVRTSFNRNVAQMLCVNRGEEMRLAHGSNLLDSLYAYLTSQTFSWHTFLSVFAIAKASAIGSDTLKDDISCVQFLICAFAELLFSFVVVQRHREDAVLFALRHTATTIELESPVRVRLVYQIVNAFRDVSTIEDEPYSYLLNTLCSTLLTYRETIPLDVDNTILEQFSTGTLKHLIAVHVTSMAVNGRSAALNVVTVANPILNSEDDGPYLDPAGSTSLQTAMANVCYAVFCEALGSAASKDFDALCHRFAQYLIGDSVARPRGPTLSLLRHAFIDVALELFAADPPLSEILKTVPAFAAMLDQNPPWRSVISAQLLANGPVARYLANKDHKLLPDLVAADMIPYAPIWILNLEHEWNIFARQLSSLEGVSSETLINLVRTWGLPVHDTGRVVLSTLLFVVLPKSTRKAADLALAVQTADPLVFPQNIVEGMKFMISPENSLVSLFQSLEVPELRQMPALASFLESPDNQIRVKLWMLEFICLPMERRATSHWYHMHENPRAMKWTPVVGDLYSNMLIHGFDCGIKTLTEGHIHRPIFDATLVEMHAIAIAVVCNLLTSAVLTPLVVLRWNEHVVSSQGMPVVPAPDEEEEENDESDDDNDELSLRTIVWNHLGWVMDAISSCINSEKSNLSGVVATSTFAYQVFSSEQARALFQQDPAIRRSYATHAERDAAEQAHLAALRAINLSEQVQNRVRYTQGIDAAELIPKLPCNRFPRAQEELFHCRTEVVDWSAHSECTRFATSRDMAEFVADQKLLPPLIDLYNLLQIHFPALLRDTQDPTIATLRKHLQEQPRERMRKNLSSSSLEHLNQGITAFNQLLVLTDGHLQFGCAATGAISYDSIEEDTPLHRITTHGNSIVDNDTTGDVFKAIQCLEKRRYESLEKMQCEDPLLLARCDVINKAFGDRLPFVLRWSLAHQCGLYDDNETQRNRALLSQSQSPETSRVYSLLQFYLSIRVTPIALETIFIPLVVIRNENEEEHGEIGDVSCDLREWLRQQCRIAQTELLPRSFRDACMQMSVVDTATTLDALINRLGASVKRAHIELNTHQLADWPMLVTPIGHTDPLYILNHCQKNDNLSMQHLHDVITFVESALQMDHFEVAKKLMGNENVLLPVDDERRGLVQALLQSQFDESMLSSTLSTYLDDLHDALSAVLLLGRKSEAYEGNIHAELTEWGEGNELTEMFESWKVVNAAAAYGELLKAQHMAIQAWCRREPNHTLYIESRQTDGQALPVNPWDEDDINTQEWDDDADVISLELTDSTHLEHSVQLLGKVFNSLNVTQHLVGRCHATRNQPLNMLRRFVTRRFSTAGSNVPTVRIGPATITFYRPRPWSTPRPIFTDLMNEADLRGVDHGSFFFCNCVEGGVPKKVQLGPRYATVDSLLKNAMKAKEREGTSLVNQFGCVLNAAYRCDEHDWIFAQPSTDIVHIVVEVDGRDVTVAGHRDATLQAVLPTNIATLRTTAATRHVVDPTITLAHLVRYYSSPKYYGVLNHEMLISAQSGSSLLFPPSLWLSTAMMNDVIVHHFPQMDRTSHQDPTCCIGDLLGDNVNEATVEMVPLRSARKKTQKTFFISHSKFLNNELRTMSPLTEIASLEGSRCIIVDERFGVVLEGTTIQPTSKQRLHVYEFESEADKQSRYGDFVINIEFNASPACGGLHLGAFPFLRRTHLWMVQRFAVHHIRTDAEIASVCTNMIDPVVHTVDGVAIGRGIPAQYLLENIFSVVPGANGNPDCHKLRISSASHFRLARLESASYNELTKLFPVQKSPFAVPLAAHIDLFLQNDLCTPNDTLVQLVTLPFPMPLSVQQHLCVEMGAAKSDDPVPLLLEGLDSLAFTSNVTPTTHVLFEHATTGTVVAVPLTEGSETTWGDAARAALRTLLIPEEAFYRYAWWMLPSRAEDGNLLDVVKYSDIECALNDTLQTQPIAVEIVQNQLKQYRCRKPVDRIHAGNHFLFAQLKVVTPQ